MNEIISMVELNSKYLGEWVLLEDPEASEKLEIRSGKLLFHSKDREEIYRKARELKPKHSAIFYIGSIADDMVVLI